MKFLKELDWKLIATVFVVYLVAQGVYSLYVEDAVIKQKAKMSSK